MSIPIEELREMYIDAKHKKKKLKQEVERLGNELRSVRNDNEQTRSVGEGMQSFEYDEKSNREPLDAANASIKEVQHSRKELDQELRTERRHNAELQASLEQAQDAKADLEHSLRRMQDAWDEANRSRASGHAERSHELEERLAEKEQSLQAQEERLQEKEQRLQAQEERLQGKEQRLQAQEERLQGKEQRLQAQELLTREQQSNLPATNPAAVKGQTGPASEQVTSMLALGAEIHTGLHNHGSRTGTLGPIRTEPLAQPNFKLSPGAPFIPPDFKSRAQVTVEPPPPVVSQPEEEDLTMAFIASFLAEVKAEEAAKADAVVKPKITDNMRIKDAAAGKNVEPGKPRSSDTPPHDVVTRKRKFEEDDFFRAQQSGPSRSQAGMNKRKYLSNKGLLGER